MHFLGGKIIFVNNACSWLRFGRELHSNLKWVVILTYVSSRFRVHLFWQWKIFVPFRDFNVSAHFWRLIKSLSLTAGVVVTTLFFVSRKQTPEDARTKDLYFLPSVERPILVVCACQHELKCCNYFTQLCFVKDPFHFVSLMLFMSDIHLVLWGSHSFSRPGQNGIQSQRSLVLNSRVVPTEG